jgi:hypothetical protein
VGATGAGDWIHDDVFGKVHDDDRDWIHDDVFGKIHDDDSVLWMRLEQGLDA